MINLAVDAMGGDYAPDSIILGVKNFLNKNTDLHVSLFGVGLQDIKDERITVNITDSFIKSDSKPSSVIRGWKNTSMGQAIASVRDLKCDAVVSAGNTGAFMALSKILLKTFPQIERPAIPAVLPTMNGKVLMLDLGANLECSANQLVQFALMGESLASHLFKIDKPSVGLLNVGSEDSKGRDLLKEAAQTLKNIPDINFFGFVEGDDISKGTTDVIVTDGFSGNVALKAIEGTAKLIEFFTKQAFNSSFIGKLAGFMAVPVFRKLKKKIDPRLHNGAMFLGVKGIAVKSHGGTDEVGFENALDVACKMVKSNVIDEIGKRINISR